MAGKGVTSNEHFDSAIIGRAELCLPGRVMSRLSECGSSRPPQSTPLPLRGRGFPKPPICMRFRAAAGLLLALAGLLAIMPMSAQAQGNAQSATYRVTFEGKFTASALVGGVSVPSGEHFTTLIGAVHNGSVTFWSSGGTASAGVEAVAELGTTHALKSEINAAMLNALAVFEQSIASGGTATATVDIVVTADHPLVTLLAMIAPNSDWFVGVSGLSLLDAQKQWLSQHQVDLFPYDAGTEEGTGFSLANATTSPQGTITNIKGTGKFSNQPIAMLTFDLLAPAAPVMSITADASPDAAGNAAQFTLDANPKPAHGGSTD